MGFVLLPLFYALALASGLAVAAASRMRTWLGRVLVAFTYAAAQILVAIQFLSLFHQLRAWPLFALNAVFTALTFGILRRSGAPSWKDWRFDSVSLKAFVRENPLTAIMAGLALSSAIVLELARASIAPYGDFYHFAMPLFWRQEASVLPFPSTSPRVTGLAFSSEALCLPGILYVNSWVIFYAEVIWAKLLLCWTVSSLARRLGASLHAAVAAGAVLLAYSPVIYGTGDLLLESLWVVGSIYLLLESFSDGACADWCFGFSIFTFTMACGAKNIATMQAPVFLGFVLWTSGRRLWAWPRLRAALLGGVLGLLCSATLWTYVANHYNFHDFRGPEKLSGTVSQDFRPVAMWTRIVRNCAGGFLDPIWLPSDLHESYGKALEETIRLAGGAKQLPEDSGYYGFVLEALHPGSGLNPLSLLVLLPSLVAALFSPGRPVFAVPALPPGFARKLALFTIGSFAICFIILKTQRTGVIRLLPSCLVLGAPLAGLWLERRWVRVGSLILQVFALTIFSIDLLIGTIRHFVDPHQLRKVAAIRCEWSDRPPETVLVRDIFTNRELFELVLARIPQPATFGSVSDDRSDDIFLFGSHFQNRVVCLRDSKDPAHTLPVPADVEYLVSESGDFADLDYRAAGFSPWFKSGERPGWGPGLVVLKRNLPPRPPSPSEPVAPAN